LRTQAAGYQKFISGSVGELYVILMGISLANVIFELDFVITNGIEIGLAIFVTAIVTRYWWVWDVHVKGRFTPTTIGFIIDFAGMIVLVLLFKHFRDPVKLAWSFLALGSGDLLWVLNQIGQSSDQTFSARWRWIGEKVLGIFIYTTGLLLVLSIQNDAGNLLRAGCVAIPAILVQLFCFREIRSRGSLTFRAAKKDDIPRILTINRDYLDNCHANGFLLERATDKSLCSLESERPARLFVALRGDTIVAYASISFTIDESVLRSLTWLDPHLERTVRAECVLHIEQIAVDPLYAGQGTGRSFYSWLSQHHPQYLPCAFVALHPRCNAASLRFHTSCGFEKAALFHREKFLGQRDYQSLLFVLTERVPKQLTQSTATGAPGADRRKASSR
jgi:GNAT superfamily N-acetyltransferase